MSRERWHLLMDRGAIAVPVYGREEGLKRLTERLPDGSLRWWRLRRIVPHGIGLNLVEEHEYRPDGTWRKYSYTEMVCPFCGEPLGEGCRCL